MSKVSSLVVCGFSAIRAVTWCRNYIQWERLEGKLEQNFFIRPSLSALLYVDNDSAILEAKVENYICLQKFRRMLHVTCNYKRTLDGGYN